jgi:hypothetical protein
MRRSARTARIALALLGVTALAFTATACAEEETTALRQVQPPKAGQQPVTVFIDGWDNDGDKGDKALVEFKPELDTWVIPNEAAFRSTKQGDYVVELQLVAPTKDNPPVWRVINLNGTEVGYDHDACQANNELYAAMIAKPVFDKDESPKGDGSDDDCARGGDKPPAEH